MYRGHVGSEMSIRHRASLDTYYGPVKVKWNKDSTLFKMAVDIPANTTAVIHIPAKPMAIITVDDKPLRNSKVVKSSGEKDGYYQVEVGSGKYVFSVK